MIINPYSFAGGGGGGGGGDLTALAHWLFNDGSGSTAVDSSGNGEDLTLYNSPTWGTGPDATGCIVLASNAYAARAGFGDFTTGDFTICAWVNPSSLANNPILFYKGEYGAGGYYLQISSGGSATLIRNTTTLGTAGGVISTGTWYHIAAVKSGASGVIYIDGASAASGTFGDPTTSSDAFQIGRYSNINNFDLAGSIDDFRIYDTAKTSGEIATIYGDGAL